MKRREPLNLDLTPLIDIVFIIIVFFLVTSTFKEKILNLTLPKSKSATINDIKQKEVIIELNSKDIVYNKEKIDLVKLSNRLEKIKDKSKTIILKVDKNVKYQRLVSVLDLLKLNDLNNLAIVTK